MDNTLAHGMARHAMREIEWANAERMRRVKELFIRHRSGFHRAAECRRFAKRVEATLGEFCLRFTRYIGPRGRLESFEWLALQPCDGLRSEWIDPEEVSEDQKVLGVYSCRVHFSRRGEIFVDDVGSDILFFTTHCLARFFQRGHAKDIKGIVEMIRQATDVALIMRVPAAIAGLKAIGLPVGNGLLVCHVHRHGDDQGFVGSTYLGSLNQRWQSYFDAVAPVLAGVSQPALFESLLGDKLPGPLRLWNELLDIIEASRFDWLRQRYVRGEDKYAEAFASRLRSYG